MQLAFETEEATAEKLIEWTFGYFLDSLLESDHSLRIVTVRTSYHGLCIISTGAISLQDGYESSYGCMLLATSLEGDI